jgi:hypothetical protein
MRDLTTFDAWAILMLVAGLALFVLLLAMKK